MSLGQTWLPLLKSLHTGRSERDLIERFAKNPDSRLFLPVFELLKKHHHQDAALELLARGLDRHPHYAAARVVYAEELFKRGVFDEAWYVLENTTSPLTENILAQELRIKLAISLGKEFEVRDGLAHMQRRGMLARRAELSALAAAIKTVAFRIVRERFIKDLSAQGISIDQIASDETADAAPLGWPRQAASASPKPAEAVVWDFGAELSADLASATYISLPELAMLTRGANQPQETPKELELDSLTLAEIYEQQGFPSKALAIYEHLRQSAPGSLYLDNKVRQLKAEEPHPGPMATESATDLAAPQAQLAAKISFLRGLLATVDGNL